ncbi:MAG: response regulator transcription factor [Bacteroidota bacterium]
MTQTSKRILVVDDEKMLRESICTLLDLYGYMAAGAENGLQARQLIDEFKPDLILCDVKMPQMDGYEFIHSLRQGSGGIGTPFIFMSAKVEKDDIRKGMNLGADDYLTKPFVKEDLLKAISTRMDRYNHLKSVFKQVGESDGLNMKFTRDEVNDKLKRLTKTEKKVLRLVAEGKTSRQIAEVLFVSFKTIENHRANMADKLAISGKLSLITFAVSIRPFLD